MTRLARVRSRASSTLDRFTAARTPAARTPAARTPAARAISTILGEAVER